MKKFFKNLIKNPILIIGLFILIFYTPFALLMPADTSLRAIITRIGIDQSPEGIELSTVIFVPTPNTSYTENYKLFTATAPNLAEALQKISNYAGKKIALNLTELIVVNEEISKNNLVLVLDALTRSADIGNNTSLICTNESAKDFLNATLNLNSASDLNIEELITYSKEKIYNTDSNIETFYQGYFSPTKISVLGYVELSEGEQGLSTSGGSSASGSSASGGSAGEQGGTQSGSEEQQKKTTILNEGRTAVYKNGIIQKVLTTEELKGVNWLNQGLNETYLTVEGVNDDFYDDATITFKLKNKTLNSQFYFVNNVPVFESVLKLVMDVDQVSQPSQNENSLQPELSYVSSKLKQKINEQIKKEFKVAQDFMVAKKLDLVQVYNSFLTYCPAKFKSFLNSLDDPNNYLEKILFKIKVEPYISI